MSPQASPYPQFTLRCLTPLHARAFAEHLDERHVVVEHVEDDQVVLRYGGTLEFVTDVACAAVLGRYADADEMVALLARTEGDAVGASPAVARAA